MQQRLSQFTESANSNNDNRFARFSSPADDLSFPRYDDDNDPLEYSPLNNNNNNNISTDDKALEAPPWITAPFAQDDLASKVSLNKFQQQLAGDWNQRILRQERYAPPTPSSSLPPPSPEFTGFDWGEEDWRKSYDSLESSFINRPATTSYPADLSAADTPFPLSSIPNSDNSVEAEEFLKEIDKDYQQLRAKVVSFLSQQQLRHKPENFSQIPAQFTTSFELPDSLHIQDRNVISKDQSPLSVGLEERRRYWPGGDWKKKKNHNSS